MTPTKRTSTAEVSVEVALDAHAALGEGPVWDDANGTLIWVDILGQAVHRWDPKIGRDHRNGAQGAREADPAAPR
jgi:sugar lactone lactonase YvrE